MQARVARLPRRGRLEPPAIVREGLRVGGATLPRLSVGLPYPAIPPRSWGWALDALAARSVPLVRLSIRWAGHERGPGVYEWGEREPALDLARLLVLMQARGLLAVLRPGPWLGEGRADVPAHLLRLDSVRGTCGGPSPVSRRLALEVERWHVEVARVVEPHVHPRGPVVAWIAGTPGGAAARLDRGDDARRMYARFLKLKYRGGRVPGSVPPVPGPRGAEEIGAALDWVEAGEAAARVWIPRTLGRRPGRARGATALPTIAAVADHPFGAGADPRAALGEVDAVALPFPRGVERDWAELRLFGLRAADLGPAAGILDLPARTAPLEPPAPLDPPTVAAALAMCGVASLDLDGVPVGGVAQGYRRWLELLAAIEHPALERHSDLLLLQNRETARLREACAARGPVPGDLGPARVLEALRAAPRDLGLRDRPEIDGAISFRALFDGLRRAGIALSVADTSVSAERLASESAALLVGFERIGRPLAKRLFEWVRAGGTLITGPRLPEADWEGAPLRLGLPFLAKERLDRVQLGRLPLEEVDLVLRGEPVLECESGPLAASAPLGRGRVVHFGFRLPFDALSRDPEQLARLAGALAAAAGVTPSYAASDPAVETELFVGEVRRFLFLANPTAEARSVEVKLGGREALREVRGGGDHLRRGERLVVPARSVLLRELVEL
jgi:hypothetical protein